MHTQNVLQVKKSHKQPMNNKKTSTEKPNANKSFARRNRSEEYPSVHHIVCMTHSLKKAKQEKNKTQQRQQQKREKKRKFNYTPS